ncbi:S8 family peptidase [Microbulbifer sp. 2201CG32-9]|uniref:S8 family peptidase n=1 Tax=Microbulbifer sp. 2201CG32-9 TaxID=3232309 RepID=UPI00345BA6AC
MKSTIKESLKAGLTISAAAFGLLSLSATAVVRDAGNDFSNMPQRIIVQYKDTTARDWPTQAAAHARRSGQAMTHVRGMALADRHVYQLDRRMTPGQLKRLELALEADPNILSVEEDALMQPQFVPNDTFYNVQWHYFEPAGGINLPLAWDQQTGSGVTVAVVDTGYVFHSDLNANMLRGYDFISTLAVANDGDGRDPDASDPGDWVNANECGPGNPPSFRSSTWHGTHVSGTVAAVTNNNLGVAGVAFNAKVVPVRVLGKCGGFISDIADGVIWASGGSVPGVPANNNPAQVINMSLGGSGACGSTYQNAINTAVANGATVVVSAGNSNADASGFRPANCFNVVTVAATERFGARSYYSNFGSIVDVSAPGGDVLFNPTHGVASTLNSGSTSPSTENYVYYQGTSMSAPHVSGTAALMYSKNSSLTPAQVENILKATTRPLPVPGSCPGGCGTGIIDANAALNAVP